MHRSTLSDANTEVVGVKGVYTVRFTLRNGKVARVLATREVELYPVAYTDDFEADIAAIEDYFIEVGEWGLALNHPDRIMGCAETAGQTTLAWAVGTSGQHEWVITDIPNRLVFTFDGKRVPMLRAKHTHRQHP